MSTLKKDRGPGSRGIALVFILAMVALLSVLVVLILARATLNRQISSSSSGQQKADQLAQGALDVILNDLRQEIAAGSRVLPANSATYNSQNVYLPNSNLTIVPAFAGYAPTATSDPLPNLLKRSAYGVPFFPSANPALYNFNQYPPSNLASNLNTGSSSSIDGRSISSTRWNKPMLMNPAQLSNFTPPDWVLLTRAGPQAFAAWNPALKDSSSTSSYVIGRYAYTVYDEGGLLDATTAGCVTSLTADFDKSSKRGRLGQADLTALPGLAQADVDKIVLWRNATTANAPTNPAQSYFDYLFHGSFATGSFQYNTTAPVDPTSAFRTTLNGDQTFLSRQDLLNFFDFTFGSGAAQDAALPYLGTFSRELNAPSYCPPNPVPTSSNTLSTAPSPVVATQYEYATNAESATLPNGNPNPNRDFPSVKFANGGTMWDGTVVTAGEPLMRRRFALSRLQLIQAKISNPAATTNDAAIHNYFGLIYSSSTGKWTYTSPDSNTVATSIKTLDQVAQLNPPREPDFFELLQAGILNGSLGKTAGTDLNGNSTSGSETVAYDSRTDFQIIQIGANIIDQSGADPAPTTITYGGTPSAGQPADFYDFFGVGNLPYISRVSQVLYRPYVAGGIYDPVTGLGNPYGTGTHPQPNGPWYRPNVSAWLQFELWNPHQGPETGPALPLRIYAVGTASVVVFNSDNNNGGDNWVLWAGNPDPTKEAVAYGSKTFDPSETIAVPSSAYTQADYFREPQTLTSSLGVTVSLPEDHLQEGPEQNPFCNGAGWDFIGLKTGDAFAPDYGAEDPNNSNTTYYPVVNGAAMNPSDGGITAGAGGISFYLQCEYPAGSGNWKTIQRIKNCVVTADTNTPLPSSWLKCQPEDKSWLVPAHSLTSVQAANGSTINKSAYRMLPDPRTDRFGVFESYRENPTQSELAGPSYNETVLPSVPGNTTRGLFGYYWWLGRMRVPNTYSYLSGYGPAYGAHPYAYSGWYDDYDNSGIWNVPDGVWAGLLMINSPNIPASISSGVTYFPFQKYFYADNDGIVRGGDAYYADGGDHDANGFTDAFGAQMGTAGTARPERPVMLNRPFRSPGELGYVHRGAPWKSLDFFTPDSADAGLLDLFCLDDQDVVAGTVDLNTRNAPIVQAILQGEAKNELASSASASGDPVFSTSDATTLAGLLVTERFGTTAATGPLVNRSELVTRFLAQNTASTNNTSFPLNKTRREALVRPLAAVGNSRTWNLLIDIIAQSGRYPTSASSLTQFQIEGEKRYWWHLAIDRITGQIVDSQLEPVYE